MLSPVTGLAQAVLDRAWYPVAMNFRVTRVWVLLAGVGCVIQGARAAAAQTGVNESLRVSVQESQSQLGALSPSQKRIFQEEVLPQASRFVRDYRASGSSVKAQVDLQAIKQFLAVAGNGASIGLILNAKEGCEKCATLHSRAQSLVLASMERRGFKVVKLAASDLGPDFKAQGDQGNRERALLVERLSSLAESRKLAGIWLLEAGLATDLDPDSGHGDEPEYLIKSTAVFLNLTRRELGASDASRVHHDEQLKILSTDSVEPAVQRLMVDGWTYLGGKSLELSAAQGMRNLTTQDLGEQDAIALQFRGFKSFSLYSQLKTAVQSRLLTGESMLSASLGANALEERKLAQGQAVWIFHTRKNTAEIRQKLVGLTLEGGAQLQWSPSVPTDAGVLESGVEGEKTIFAEVLEP